MIEEKIGHPLPRELLVSGALGMENSYNNLFYIFRLLRESAMKFPEHRREMTGIAEVKIGSSVELIHKIFGAQMISVHSGDPIESSQVLKRVTSTLGSKLIGAIFPQERGTISKKGTSDIFINEGLMQKYRDGFSKDFRSIVRNNINSMRKIEQNYA